MNTYKMNEIEKNLNLLGRSGLFGGVMVMDMTLSGFEFSANFSGDLNIDYCVSHGTAKLAVIADNDFENAQFFDLFFDKQMLGTVCVHLPEGLHTVRIVKSSEYCFGSLCVTAIAFDGDFSSKPRLPEYKFEFYGDSLTCGYGNLCENRNTPPNTAVVENSLMTYCSQISRAANADISVSSASGFGITISCGGNVNDTFKAFWNRLSPNRGIDWDFDRYVADVVFFNLGTNDVNFCRNNDHKISYDTFHSTLKELVDGVRSHNPDCYLVFVSGVAGDMKVEDKMDVEAVYSDFTKEYDKAFFFDKMYTKQQGGDWHPNVEDHTDLAARMLDKLKEAIPEIFAK